MASSKALVILANGAQEMQVTITTEILRRAQIDVTLAGVLSDQPITCSHGIMIVPDKSLDEAARKGPYDVIILPGRCSYIVLLYSTGVPLSNILCMVHHHMYAYNTFGCIDLQEGGLEQIA